MITWTDLVQRIRELDGLRALAVLAVLAFHYTLGSPLANRASGLGWMGVDLFFVLSGYLITGILLASRRRPGYFATFYARRTLRIFPIYYLLLAIYLVAARVDGGPQPWAYWGMHAAYLSSSLEHFHSWNFAAPAFVYAGVTVLWSLSIEEQFYLLWAPVVRWLGRRELWMALGAVLVAAPLVRHGMHTRWHPEYRFLPARFDSLAWGALLALAFQAWGGRPERLGRGLAGLGWVAGLALAGLLAATGGQRQSLAFATYGYTALGALFAAVVGWTVLRAGSGAWLCRGLRWRPAQALGRISYATYLIHYPILLLVGGWLRPWLGGGAWATVARDLLSLGLTLAVAAASWRWVEGPILRFKDRWAPARGFPIEPQPVRMRTADVAASREPV
ncbi:MAG TPA: acyltransferase [Terriglobales bacterium]|nr:acyltransferase [Terriglobales bacterium]